MTSIGPHTAGIQAGPVTLSQRRLGDALQLEWQGQIGESHRHPIALTNDLPNGPGEVSKARLEPLKLAADDLNIGGLPFELVAIILGYDVGELAEVSRVEHLEVATH